tara:strand:+ start:682 stop:1341 length:660 start_codon:yes stop_codon:yes gene_type:complete
MADNNTPQESSFINPSVDAIKSRLSAGGGLLRQHNVKINLGGPVGLGWTSELNRELNDLLQDTTLPSKTHATQPVYYGGPLTQVPYITTYPGTISLTLICPERSSVRDKFYSWLDTVVFAKEGVVNYRDKYIGKQMDIQVSKSPKKFSTGPSDAIRYTLFDVFPDSINEITVSQNAQNDYVRMTVVLMYRKWIKGNAIDQIVETPLRSASTATSENQLD